MSIAIRKATAEDRATLLGLICALADYERLDRPTTEAQARLAADAWPVSGSPRFTAWLAELHAGSVTTAIGYAITFYTYSSFLAKPTLYLEDLFILPEYRREGAGSAMFRKLKEEAEANGCGRIEWVVLDWNTTAQDFYRKIGATHLKEWYYYRLTL